ncbi:carboxy methyl transferase for protein phosphatase 2A [Tulasnella sp. JGI-2019a]|nr:carboxy methyl transferase for protein phosphatase 2A [Tulasnella sp. JGI-2019a]
MNRILTLQSGLRTMMLHSLGSLPPPLINIGTFLRCRSIDTLLQNWITLRPEGESVQVVSLGAGTDTRYWRLSEGPLRDRISKYVEIDFPEMTSRKAMAVLKTSTLRAALGNDTRVEKGGIGLSSPIYHLVPADLRKDLEGLFASLLAILSPDRPIIVIAECVFPYIETSTSTQILQWFTGNFSNVAAVIYEMFGLGDSFGKVMRANMQDRSIELRGVDAHPTIESHRQRFLTAGFSSAQALSLKDVRLSYTSQSELERISNLEWLDEVEELDLVLGHYAVSWGSKSETPERAPWGLQDAMRPAA